MTKIAFDIDGVLAHGLDIEELKNGAGNDIYAGLEFAPESTGVMQRFRQGNGIYILTARPEDCREVTEEWLRRNGVEYNGLFLNGYSAWELGPRHKAEVVEREGIRLLVDDDPRIVDYVNENTGCTAVLFRGWNQINQLLDRDLGEYDAGHSVIRCETLSTTRSNAVKSDL